MLIERDWLLVSSPGWGCPTKPASGVDLDGAFKEPDPFLTNMARAFAGTAQPFADGVGGRDQSEYEVYEVAAEMVFGAIARASGDGVARTIFARLARRKGAHARSWAKQQRLIRQVYRIKRAAYEAAHGPLLGDTCQKPFPGPQRMADLVQFIVDVGVDRQRNVFGLRGSTHPATVERHLHAMFKKWEVEQAKYVGL